MKLIKYFWLVVNSLSMVILDKLILRFLSLTWSFTYVLCFLLFSFTLISSNCFKTCEINIQLIFITLEYMCKTFCIEKKVI